MSNITANIVVESNQITITPQPLGNVNISSEPITATVSTVGFGPAGAPGQLQFNDNGKLGGTPNSFWDGSNLTLGDVSNVKIQGGDNGFALQTDGTGNLFWTGLTGFEPEGNGVPGGANTQIQFNAGGGLFGGTAGFTISANTLNVPGDVIIPNTSKFQGNTLVLHTLSPAIGRNAEANTGTVTGIFPGTSIGGGARARRFGDVCVGFLTGSRFGAAIANLGPLNTFIGYSAGTNAVSNVDPIGGGTYVGAFAGQFQGAGDCVAVGTNAGQGRIFRTGEPGNGIITGPQGANAVAIGSGSGAYDQGDSAVALGFVAGRHEQGNNSIAIGRFAAYGPDSVPAGNRSGQGENSIAIGTLSSFRGQGNFSISIGPGTGTVASNISAEFPASYNSANRADPPIQVSEFRLPSSPITGYPNIQDDVIVQSNLAIAIGYISGSNAQGEFSVALGAGAGVDNQGSNSVAIGSNAAVELQGTGSIAIGLSAGELSQGNSSIAIGDLASTGEAAGPFGGIGRSQGDRAVAIGSQAGRYGQGDNSVALGAFAGFEDQANNSIVINATGANLNAPTANALFVKPIRTVSDNTGLKQLYYDPSTGEIVFYDP